MRWMNFGAIFWLGCGSLNRQPTPMSGDAATPIEEDANANVDAGNDLMSIDAAIVVDSSCPTRCVAMCVDLQTDVSNCGACDNDCYLVAPPDAKISCYEGECKYDCGADKHRCAAKCVDNNDVNACGSSCVVCRPPLHGYTACDGVACTFSCLQGYTLVGSTCVAMNGFAVAATAIATGASHSCAVTNAGVTCWGANDQGQLGDGTTTARATPVYAVGLTWGYQAVAAGDAFSCVLDTATAVTCWGDNSHGQFNSRDMMSSLIPRLGSSGYIAFSAGAAHMCALTQIGWPVCWGGNSSGQLGSGDMVDSVTPLNLTAPRSMLGISAGAQFSCGISDTNALYCWGANARGQLGINAMLGSLVPIQASGLGSGMSAVAAGVGHACALTTGGGVKCWGQNDHGQLGNSATQDSLVAVDVPGLSSGGRAICVGAAHTCILLPNGSVQCWGDNSAAQIGTTMVGGNVGAPHAVATLDSTAAGTAISCGAKHTCLLDSSGGVKCWGDNAHGQIGNRRVGGTVATPTSVSFTP